MPKHNFAMLTCVDKTVQIITTTLYIQVNYTALFSGQIGLSFGAKCDISAVRSQHKDRYANMQPHRKKPSSMRPHICVTSASRG
ncbi:unnamed protein product [Staurois parvus]|uniref:Uncharacterized protein n=1 Tax=Staurois parvus TaxID=386267 RepID=A0ABN9G9Z4_9NEOB|nr:unnamed protein product [Staurois parvus]